VDPAESNGRESGTVCTCPPGQHDDLGISCAMLAWAAGHQHLSYWVSTAISAGRLKHMAGSLYGSIAGNLDPPSRLKPFRPH